MCACDRKGLVDTFLRYLSGSWGTPYRSRHYLFLQMDEEKAIDHLFLPQRLSSVCFYCQRCFGRWQVTVGDKVRHHAMTDVTCRAGRRCMDFLVVSPDCWEWFWGTPTVDSSVTKTGLCCSKRVKRSLRWHHPVFWNDIHSAAAGGEPPLIPSPCVLCQINQLLRCLGLGMCLWLLMAQLWFTVWFLARSIPFGCGEIPACSQHVQPEIVTQERWSPFCPHPYSQVNLGCRGC